MDKSEFDALCRERWDRVSASVYTMCFLYVLTAGAVGIYTASNYFVKQGQIELHDCSTGKTLACEVAVEKSTGDRMNLYLTAYRQATGHDLPRVYGR